ncbi:MAG: putative glycolipid-binding domain-containing protein [Chloroflexi bacterium]|nr:putative glycolipid-binding domain-containing protein [Chloroflexota bacterium]HEV8053338.1 putative glycolipid-binding domain-containing protein [Candidatus Limnocylindrales bacterium]
MKTRSVAWVKEGRYGADFVDVELGDDSLCAEGVSVGGDPVPYRLDYALETSTGWVTTSLQVKARGEGWQRSLDLRRSADGTWTQTATVEGNPSLPEPGGDLAAVNGALDCDLGLAPLTNTMPVLRHRLLNDDGSLEFLMAWVSVPDLVVHASRQGYTTLGWDPDGHRLIQYASLDSDFRADLTFDADGLVADYPQLGRRLR